MRVREATAADNEALLAVTAACPMAGDVGLCITREPDFFALNRLEGSHWAVGVVDGPDGTSVACVAVAERTAYLHGEPTPVMYVSDLKVVPAHRGSGAADALVAWARERCLDTHGAGAPVFLTVLAGNRAMDRRLRGQGASMVRFATLRSSSISLLWPRRPVPGMRLTRATTEDLPEMADLWARVAPGRQLAPVHDAATFGAWVETAPALDLSSYWLARDDDGRLLGFAGFWDQESFKQMRVTSYSAKLAAVRRMFNATAPFMGATRLPPTGGALRYLTAVHVCVPADSPRVLRAIVLAAYNELRGKGYSFVTVGLDVRDPLSVALRGLLGQPTDVEACLWTPGGPYDGRPLDDRPVHVEIALV